MNRNDIKQLVEIIDKWYAVYPNCPKNKEKYLEVLIEMFGQKKVAAKTALEICKNIHYESKFFPTPAFIFEQIQQQKKRTPDWY